MSDLILEEHGTLGEATISDFPLYFIPLEQDLLSLELDNGFSELYLRNEPSCIFDSAQALMGLQKQYGLFPRILGKGDNAKRLADLLVRMRSEEDVNAANDPGNAYLTSFGLTPSALVENLIIVDREVDFPTILATQLTYEGLIDETFGIANNQTEVDTSILGSAPPPQAQQGATHTPTAATKRKVQLDSSDKLFPELRDANFATIGPTLNRTARRLQSDQQTIKDQDQSIADLKSFVSKLPTYQAEQASLKIHTSLAEEILKTTRGEIFGAVLEVQQNLLAGSDPSSLHENIETLIARDVPLKTVLRLLCLESCLSNGLRSRDLENFKPLTLHVYGYQHILTLANLEKAGLLLPRESHRAYLNPIAATAGQTSTDWNAVRKGLKLWVDDTPESDPDDVAYVFSGYAPLSVRLVQAILQKSYLYNLVNAKAAPSGSGWTGFTDVLGRIRGATVDMMQKGHDADASLARRTLRGSKEGPKVQVVFFLGGVTFAEIAALRFVSKQMEEKEGRKIVICTTALLAGSKTVGMAVERKEFGS